MNRKFSRKRKKKRKLSYNDYCINQTRAMLIDKRLGYNVPTGTYNK